MCIREILSVNSLLCISNHGSFWNHLCSKHLFFSFSRSVGTVLSYEVNVIPRFNFPAIFLERIIRSDLPVNLRAVARQAEKIYKDCGKPSIIEDLLGIISSQPAPSNGIEFDSLATERSVASSVGSLAHSNELNNNWGVYGKACKLDKPCTVDEVHLRRFDGLLVSSLAQNLLYIL